MSLDTDLLVDRRNLRRKLTFWRIFAIIVIVIGLLSLLGWSLGGADVEKRTAHIARLAFDGIITEDRDLMKMIKEIEENDAVKGVIVSINSPGGTTTGGETIYNALHDLGQKKPLVAEIRTVGASAGYMIALAADHIVARYNTITGSIGVLFQYGNAAKLFETVGVEMDAVKSSPLKAEPDFYSPTTPEAKAVLQDLVDDSYDWFINLVAERRNLSPFEARKLADGRIYSGFAASNNGLIDAIGSEQTALDWLEDEKSVQKELPVVTWSVPRDERNLPFSIKMSNALGNAIANGLLESVMGAKRLISPAFMLDGLVSVWQAQSAGAQDARP
ncbi:MAG: signal peptide peptidase SppA [Rhodobacteraceae bacterium]|nr:signal peptide peptidase SppA [Paracoccaceae bacterium]